MRSSPRVIKKYGNRWLDALWVWISARIALLGEGREMRLLLEAVIIVVVIYIAVRMFRTRG